MRDTGDGIRATARVLSRCGVHPQRSTHEQVAQQRQQMGFPHARARARAHTHTHTHTHSVFLFLHLHPFLSPFLSPFMYDRNLMFMYDGNFICVQSREGSSRQSIATKKRTKRKKRKKRREGPSRPSIATLPSKPGSLTRRGRPSGIRRPPIVGLFYAYCSSLLRLL